MGRPPDSIRVLAEPDLLDLARVARSTWQNWTKKGLVAESRSGHYMEGDVVDVLLAGLLVDALDLRRAGLAWPPARGHVLPDCLALPLEDRAELDLVVDLFTLDLATTGNAADLHAAVHAEVPTPRGQIVLVVGAIVQEARRAFWKRAVSTSALAPDKRRKSHRATVSRRSRSTRDEPS